jgi:hypothetical protein
MLTTGKKLKIRIRILRVVLRFAATCIAIGTATQEGITLVTYLHTRDHIEDGRGPWALKTELWTSILLFAASVLTVILGVIMVAAYLISIRAANKVSTWQTWFASIIEIGHVALWIGVAIGYRVRLRSLSFTLVDPLDEMSRCWHAHVSEAEKQ